jgi:hypothetical protein
MKFVGTSQQWQNTLFCHPTQSVWGADMFLHT